MNLFIYFCATAKIRFYDFTGQHFRMIVYICFLERKKVILVYLIMSRRISFAKNFAIRYSSTFFTTSYFWKWKVGKRISNKLYSTWKYNSLFSNDCNVQDSMYYYKCFTLLLFLSKYFYHKILNFSILLYKKIAHVSK